MEVFVKEKENSGYAIAREGEERAGAMTFRKPSEDHIIIDHTEVEPEYKGQGVGKKMLYKIVEWAREEGIKITPLCPFAAAMFKKLDDIQDVFKK